MAPSFDTPGWFAREVDLLEKIGDVLLPGLEEDISKTKLHIAREYLRYHRLVNHSDY